MTRLATYGRHFSATLKYYLNGVYQALFVKDVFLWAQAIAFKVLITIVPVVILATGILSRTVLGGDDAFARIARFIRDFLPPYESDQLIQFLHNLQSASGTLTIIGIAALVFSAMTLFTTLRVVIGNVFQEEWHKERSVVVGYAFDLRMAAQVGLLFVLTIGLTVAMSYLNTRGLALAREQGLDYVWLREGWRNAFRILGLLIPYLLSIAMFFQLFFFIPKPRPPKRSALLGAVVTALLWEIAKASFAIYATNVGRFDRYALSDPEAESLTQALGQAFGLIIAFVFWVYYSGIVLCLGGLIASLHEKRHRLKHLREQNERIRAALLASMPEVNATAPAALFDDAPEAGDAKEDKPGRRKMRKRKPKKPPSDTAAAAPTAGAPPEPSEPPKPPEPPQYQQPLQETFEATPPSGEAAEDRTDEDTAPQPEKSQDVPIR